MANQLLGITGSSVITGTGPPVLCTSIHTLLMSTFLTTQLKMHNHLAEQVLTGNMQHLVQEYQKHVGRGSVLDSTVEFLVYKYVG